jgi:nicotinate dehydrogenase subunit A
VSATPEWSTAPVQEEDGFGLRVNGRRWEVRCRPDTPLLYILRNDLGLKGSRYGCGLGQCGACMVLLDGKPTPSCDLPVWSVQGHEVVTIEGLVEDDAGMQALQRSFTDQQAAQCGYCTSGILVSACALLRTQPSPDRAAIHEALDRNLCRCGSQGRVVRAVLGAAESLGARGAPPAAGATV